MRASWWKILATILVAYAIIGGLMMPVPRLNILNETIRNLYFHVPMWFGMIILFAVSAVYAVKYLRGGKMENDIRSVQFLKIGVLFSILGMITGMEWAQFTWGQAWSNDPKQLATAVCMLSYFAYLMLRSGMKDEEKRARISAVYNIFAFALLIPLLFVLPRLVDSLHPSNGGNAGFVAYDLDSQDAARFLSGSCWLDAAWCVDRSQRIRLAEFQRSSEIAQLSTSKKARSNMRNSRFSFSFSLFLASLLASILQPLHSLPTSRLTWPTVSAPTARSGWWWWYSPLYLPAFCWPYPYRRKIARLEKEQRLS